MHLAAGLPSDPLRELTALPLTRSWIKRRNNKKTVLSQGNRARCRNCSFRFKVSAAARCGAWLAKTAIGRKGPMFMFIWGLKRISL